MWRRLLARAHPDAGGTHELFIWTGAVRDVVCGSSLRGAPRPDPDDHSSRRLEGSTHEDPACVPFDEDAYLEVLTDRAVTMAAAVAEPYGYLLRQLADCYPVSVGPLRDQQRRGASYKALAAIGHTVGMTKAERVQWYSIAEAVPLSAPRRAHPRQAAGGGRMTDRRAERDRGSRKSREAREADEVAWEPSRARAREKGGVPFTQSERPNCKYRHRQVPGNPKIR
jgi:hypothetical protein